MILDIRFPEILYRKLLGRDSDGIEKFTLDDLTMIDPMMGKSLKQVLEMKENVAETLCYSFVGTYECFGASVEVPLKPGGEELIVTNENREEY